MVFSYDFLSSFIPERSLRMRNSRRRRGRYPGGLTEDDEDDEPDDNSQTAKHLEATQVDLSHVNEAVVLPPEEPPPPYHPGPPPSYPGDEVTAPSYEPQSEISTLGEVTNTNSNQLSDTTN